MAAGTAAFGTLDTWLVWKLTQGGTFVTGTHDRVVLRAFVEREVLPSRREAHVGRNVLAQSCWKYLQLYSVSGIGEGGCSSHLHEAPTSCPTLHAIPTHPPTPPPTPIPCPLTFSG